MSLNELLKGVYGSLVNGLIELLKRPPSRLYARVNTIRTTRERVLEELRSEGVIAYPDELIPDAIFFEVEGPHELKCPGSGKVVVDLKTAISLVLGANLYRPGVLKADPFNAGDYVMAVTQRGTPVACIKTVRSRSDVLSRRRGIVGINVSSPYRAPRIADTRVYQKGLIYVQSAPSIITSHVLGPRASDLVIDMNASPGGKTSHIVQLTRGKARVIAIDRNEKKVKELRSTLQKLGLLHNVVMVPADSRYIHLDFNVVGKADKVLIDPPCSNSGVRPLLDYSRTLKDVLNLANYQRQFLKAAWHVLKPGGILVYSTCTLTTIENEENALYAIREIGFNSIELEKTPPYAEKVSYKGLVAYRFSPLSWDMPGYFIAVFSK